MPVYEYECSACDKVFEVQQRMSEAPLKNCPDCAGEVRKLVSVSSFQLKGGELVFRRVQRLVQQ